MSQLMDQARALLQAGRWLDVRAIEPDLLAQSGDDLIVAHAQLHMAYIHSAARPEDWRRARSHVHAILNTAPKSSPTYAWALQAAAAVNINLRRPHEAQIYAKAFLREVVRRSELHYLVPFAWQNLGAAAVLLRQFQRAAQCYRVALAGLRATGTAEEQQRVELFIAWSLLRAGGTEVASNVLPAEPLMGLQSLWHAIRAQIARAKSDWAMVAAEAAEALRHEWSSIDYIEAAEMCLLLAQADLRRGARAEAIRWTKKATEFAARLGRADWTRLVLATAAEGGDFLAAVASRGSGGYHPDACFSTGVGG